MGYLPYECSVCRDRYASDQENRYKRTLGISAEKIRREHAHVHRDMYADPQQLPITNFPIPSKEKELLRFVDGPYTVPDEVDLLLMVDGDENRGQQKNGQQQNGQVSPRKRLISADSPLKELKKKKFLADPETSSFDGDEAPQDTPLPIFVHQSSSAATVIVRDDDFPSESTRSPDRSKSTNVNSSASHPQQANQKHDDTSAITEKNASDEMKECPNCYKPFKDVIRHLRKCSHKVVDFPKASPVGENSKIVPLAEEVVDVPRVPLEEKKDDSERRMTERGDDEGKTNDKRVLALTKDERECPECKSQLADHRSLKRHALNVKKCAEKLVVYTTAPQSNENGEHQCAQCDERFDSALDVAAHLRFKHTQLPPSLA
uniref:C2H2-type domain-containing protein n=1 Tax=Plectus sambesii TaxID=2011161 RepID=A0A914WEN6_9BILA